MLENNLKSLKKLVIILGVLVYTYNLILVFMSSKQS